MKSVVLIWLQNLNFESKLQTACWTEGMGPTGIFVRLAMIHMQTESCACRRQGFKLEIL